MQWICTELINHLNTQKRYGAIPQDIDLMAQKLLKEDRLFNEGVCRPERISRNNQTTIFYILEKLAQSKLDIGRFFDRDIVTNLTAPFDLTLELARLKYLEIIQEEDECLKFCSPLHAKWFESNRLKGLDIST